VVHPAIAVAVDPARRPELVNGMSTSEMARLLVLRPTAEASYVRR